MSNGMNDYYTNYVQSINNLTSVNDNDATRDTDTNEVNATDTSSIMSTEFFTTPITELCVKDMLMICIDVNKPLARKLDVIQNDVSSKVTLLEQKIKLLETENSSKEEKIETLTSIIVTMQKNLNAIDGNSRSNCAIISGVPENDLTSHNNEAVSLQTDHDKVKELLKITENSYFSEDSIENFEISRLGKPRPGANRTIKIKLASTKDRNEFLKDGYKLKALEDPWKKIYIKKDLHPVYIQENTRIRKKLFALMSDPDNEGKDIKLEKGILTIDGVPIDHNTFFV